MTDVVAAVVLADRGLLLRVYRSGVLVVEAPLSRRRALLLASDVLNALLLPQATGDALEPDATSERRIADVGIGTHAPNMGAHRRNAK